MNKIATIFIAVIVACLAYLVYADLKRDDTAGLTCIANCQQFELVRKLQAPNSLQVTATVEQHSNQTTY